METERVHLDWRFRLGWIATYVIGWELVVQLIRLVVARLMVAVILVPLAFVVLALCCASTGCIVGQMQKMLLRGTLPQMRGWRRMNAIGWLIAGLIVTAMCPEVDVGLRMFNKGIIYRFNRILAVAFSPDGTRALTGSEDGTAILWDVATGERIATFAGHTKYVGLSNVTAVAFSPDGTDVATGGFDKTAKLWDPGTAKEVFTFIGHEHPVQSVAFSPDGAKLLTGSSDFTAKLWDVGTGKELRTFAGHEDGVNSATFSPDGTRVLTASNDNTARLWSTATGEQLNEIAYDGSVNVAVFSPDGSKLITPSGNGVNFRDSTTGAKLATLTGLGEDRLYVSSIAVAPDGSKLLTASYTTARLSDASTGHPIHTMAGHGDTVTAVAFSPDGTKFLTGSADGARMWDTASGEELRAFNHTSADWLLGTANLCLYAGLLALGAGAAGLSVGLLQWTVLRRHVPRTGRWIWANAGAWFLGAFVVEVLLANLVPQTGQAGGYSAVAAIGNLPVALAVATGGAIVGAATYCVLTRLLHSA